MILNTQQLIKILEHKNIFFNKKRLTYSRAYPTIYMLFYYV